MHWQALRRHRAQHRTYAAAPEYTILRQDKTPHCANPTSSHGKRGGDKAIHPFERKPRLSSLSLCHAYAYPDMPRPKIYAIHFQTAQQDSNNDDDDDDDDGDGDGDDDDACPIVSISMPCGPGPSPWAYPEPTGPRTPPKRRAVLQTRKIEVVCREVPVWRWGVGVAVGREGCVYVYMCVCVCGYLVARRRGAQAGAAGG
jgi:hypothetical protein